MGLSAFNRARERKQRERERKGSPPNMKTPETKPKTAPKAKPKTAPKGSTAANAPQNEQ